MNKIKVSDLYKVCSTMNLSIKRDVTIDGRMGLGDGYCFCIRNKGIEYSTEYNDSIMNKGKKPNLVDAFASVLIDSNCYESCRDYQDFCDMFGYKASEGRARVAFNGCKRTNRYFHSLFTPSQIEKFQELLRDY